MTKVLIATDKPFAPVAVKGIREIVEAQGYELALLEKYTSPEELIAAVADVDAMIIRSDKATKEVMPEPVMIISTCRLVPIMA